MATIQEKVKNNKLVSCKFRAFLGKDEEGKQICKYHTWHPPEHLTITFVSITILCTIRLVSLA